MMNSIRYMLPLVAVVVTLTNVEGFQQMHVSSTQRVGVTSLSFFGNDNKNDELTELIETAEEEPQKKGFDFKGMMNKFDAVVDDFVYKRMGNGEQFYGKRKSNPSGNIEGDYNGMGQSDLLRIEIARVQKEEMELRRQRRLAAEQEARGDGKSPRKWG